MKVCSGCHKKNDDVKFCVFCGTALSNDLPISGINDSEEMVRNDISIVKDKRNYKKIVIWVLTVMLLTVSIFFIGKRMYDPHKVVKEIEQAYIERDATKLSSYFKVPENTENKDLILMINLYGWDKFESLLNEGINSLVESNSNSKVITDSVGLGFITLQKEPKVFGVFQNVKVNINPVEFYVVAPYKGTQIVINDHEIITDDANKPKLAGLFLPGEYNLSALYKSQMGDFKVEYPFSIKPDHSSPFEIQFAETSVAVNSDITDATLFVNNESTGRSIEEIQYLSPVPENSNIEVYAEFKDTDGTVYKSSVEKLNGSQVYLSFDDYKNKQQSLELHEERTTQLVNQFRLDYLDAITAADFNYVSSYFEEGSPIYKEYKKFVEDHSKIKEYSYDFLENDITSFIQISEKDFEIETFETFNYSSVTDGKYYYERKKKYSITLDNNQYFVTKIENLDSKKTKQE
ncbi:hypothetical protein P8610_12930 [Fictibacillus sp. UD]|uniref:TcaA NTF2-like domain-containing protein n=1 Tax=Fictibacillus sp. UD TaxID=3038777 RepID=UPI003745CE35